MFNNSFNAFSDGIDTAEVRSDDAADQNFRSVTGAPDKIGCGECFFVAVGAHHHIIFHSASAVESGKLCAVTERVHIVSGFDIDTEFLFEIGLADLAVADIRLR